VYKTPMTPFVLALGLTLAPGTEIKAVTSNLRGRWEVTAKYPVFDSGTAVAAMANDVARNEAIRSVKDFISSARRDQKEFPQAMRPYYFSSKPTISVDLPDLVSFFGTVETYSGGAHGMQVFVPHSFARVKGKARALALKDLFVTGVDPLKIVSDLVITKLKQIPRADWVQNGEVKALTKAQGESFVVTKTGLTFLFEPYAMGSYASGPFLVKVAFSELKGKLDPAGPLRPLLSASGG